MFKILLFFFVIHSFIAAYSKPERNNKHYSDSKSFGIIIGEPTGFSYKQFDSYSFAWNLGLSWSFDDENSLYSHLDFLKHIDIHENELRDLKRTSIYYGIGFRVKFSDKTKLGGRFPFGIEFNFYEIPINVFFEIAPIFNIVPSTDFDLNGGFGIRYFF